MARLGHERSAIGLPIYWGNRWGLVVEHGPDGIDVLWLPGEPERIPYERNRDDGRQQGDGEHGEQD